MPEGPPLKRLGHRFVSLYLLILLMALAVGLTYSWQHRKVQNLQKQVASLNTQVSDLKKQVEAAKSSATTPAPTTSSTKYFLVAELGVKFQLSDDIKDAYYQMRSDGKSANLRVHSLDNEADCKNTDLSVAGLFKANKNDTIASSDSMKVSDSYKGLLSGNDFYYILHAQYYCSQDTTKQALINKVFSAFMAASATITKP